MMSSVFLYTSTIHFNIDYFKNVHAIKWLTDCATKTNSGQEVLGASGRNVACLTGQGYKYF